MSLALLIFISAALQAQQAVKTHEGVDIEGILQWIGAKGSDDSKPVLLFLHGGPGFSSRNYSKKFIRHLQKDFIVVQWDQRETGITSHWGPYEGAMTLDLFYQDTEEVVNYVLERFDKKKIYLVGFSWGGFLGLHFAHEHPELLHAYISVSSMIYQDEAERLTLALLKEKARSANDLIAMEEMSTIQIPFSSWEQLYLQRKWTALLIHKSKSGGKYPKKVFQEWNGQWMPLYVEAAKVNYAKTVPAINCPIFFFVSHQDYVANYKVGENYFHKLEATQKELIWFEESTHEIPSEEPIKFSEELIRISKLFGH